MRDLVILGSTGSIGVQALELIAANPGKFRVVAITSAGNNPALLIEQAKKFSVGVVGTIHNAELIRDALPSVTVIDGKDAAAEVASITCDVVLNAITGSIGLAATLSALKVLILASSSGCDSTCTPSFWVLIFCIKLRLPNLCSMINRSTLGPLFSLCDGTVV